MSDNTKSGMMIEDGFHPEFNDVDANIIIESNDGQKFRIHDYFLKTQSPVFRNMLALSTGSKDTVVSLPDSGEEIAALLKVISRKAGDVEAFSSNLQESFRLLKLARKYDVDPSWIGLLVCRFIKEDPLECFALACENIPAEAWLARKAITFFPSSSIHPLIMHGKPLEDYPGFKEVKHELIIRPNYAESTNPAYWTTEYTQRLGLFNYACYVRAWSWIYIERYESKRSPQEALNELASAFYSYIQK